MVSFTSSLAIAASALLSVATATNVQCQVNGVVLAVVDLDTGSCPFVIPSSLPVAFKFSTPDDYDVTFYYAIAKAVKYYTDIQNAGRIISIPAKNIFGGPPLPLFKVHAEKTPAVNSTEGIRKRLLGYQLPAKRDELSDFIAGLKELPGTLVTNPDGSSPFGEVSVVAATSSSASSTPATSAPTSSAPASSVPVSSTPVTSAPVSSAPATTSQHTVTLTNTESTLLTITSCSDHVCHESTVPATLGPVTTTVEGVETIYTTYCPVTTETPATVAPVTSTVTPVTTTVTPVTTTITPATVAPVTSTVTPVTITKSAVESVATWSSAYTKTISGTEVVVTSVITITSAVHTTAAPVVSTAVTVAPVSTAAPAVITTAFEGMAGSNKVGLLALVALPLAYLL